METCNKKEKNELENCNYIKKYDFVVNEHMVGKRLDVFLTNNLEDSSRGYIQKLIKNKDVLVNEKVEKVKYLLKLNDKIEIKIPEPKELEIKAENIDIEIIYEDDDIIIVNKPQGMVVHPAPGNYNGTLVNALMYHCKDKLSSINGVIRPGIVHRIDKDTSGILMIAKNNKAHAFLSNLLKTHDIIREYHFICYGVFKEDKVTVNKPIGRNPKDRLKMAIVEDGRNAITHFEVIERFEGYTYVKATLETGRTHQIRVHSRSLNYPLVGDSVYGVKKSKLKKIKGQMLHAKKLGFIHPTTGKYVEFESKLPERFEAMLKKLRNDKKN